MNIRSLLIAFSALAACPAAAQPAPKASALARLPVREVTVFKDGHAFVLHEGTMPTDGAGNVLLDYLPSPVVGAFWPYVPGKDARLTAVTASRRSLLVERTALTHRELLEANVGKSVVITETDKSSYEAVVLGFPERKPDETDAPETPTVKSDLVLLRTKTGVKAVAVARILDVTFKGAPHPSVASEEFRNLLTLKLDWGGRAPARTSPVGMVYLQKGIRWIPGYKVELDGAGSATVRLQATLINEMTDLKDATANLVVGVPTFVFQDTPDPIGLQQGVAQLSRHFRPDVQTGQMLSNSIMSQVPGGARFGERRGDAPSGEGAPGDLGPEIGGGEKSEDLYVFTVRHVTLKKGERMVLPVAEFTLKYRDVYVLDLPFAPPREIRGNLNGEQQRELARLLAAPRVMHKIRLVNNSPHPLTTAPALLLRQGKLLAQGMMTYTSIGGATDLSITAAVDIKAKKKDVETGRTPNAVVYQGDRLARVDLAGTVTLTNLHGQPVEVEVVRHVLGNVDSADRDGVVERLNVLEDDGVDGGAVYSGYPSWWAWYSWPHWWSRHNGVGRITWTLRLDTGQSADLGYKWHYFAP